MIEREKYPQIVDLGNKEIKDLLTRVNFGHLGLSQNNTPYVVPIHFAYADSGIYFFTTEGKKTEIIDENPIVCLQIEDIRDRDDWESVIITGTAQLLTDEDDIEKAMKLIKKINPQLVPAWGIRWIDSWVRANIDAVYRILPDTKIGRRAIPPT